MTAWSLAGEGEGGPERDMVGVGLSTPDTEASARDACMSIWTSSVRSLGCPLALLALTAMSSLLHELRVPQLSKPCQELLQAASSQSLACHVSRNMGVGNMEVSIQRNTKGCRLSFVLSMRTA